MPGTLPISKPEKPISGWAATVLCHGLSRTPPGSLRLQRGASEGERFALRAPTGRRGWLVMAVNLEGLRDCLWL